MSMITKLTEAQEAMLAVYHKQGVEIGLATGAEMDEEQVKILTDTHRTNRGLKAATNFLVFDSPMAAMKEVAGINCSNALYGQHDINWLIFYEFWRKECNVQGLDVIEPLLELAKRVGWMWMCDDTTVVTRRPVELHLKDGPQPGIKILHNSNGMAMKYADGNGLYKLNQVRIPLELGRKFLEVAPENMDVEALLKISNVEVRMELLKRADLMKVLDKLPHSFLETKTMAVGGTYSLIELQLSDRIKRRYLKGECPTNSKPFFEPVAPECQTVVAALAFRNNMDAESFCEPVQLT